MNNEKNAIRQLILSNEELGFILNERYKFFPQTLKFYKKYKRFKFWINKRSNSVLLSEPRYYALSAVLNCELQTYIASFWVDYDNSLYKTAWVSWQSRITNMRFNKDFVLKRKYAGHPYTDIFGKRRDNWNDIIYWPIK